MEHYVPRKAPKYMLKPIDITEHEEGTLYKRYHCDLRLFFGFIDVKPYSINQSTPSASNRSHPYAREILGRARLAAVCHGKDCKVQIMPADTNSIERVESVTLKDGRQYIMSTTWRAPPKFAIRENTVTQVEPSDWIHME